MRCYIIPPHITSRLPLPDRPLDLAHDSNVRQQRQATSWAATGDPAITVYDAMHRQATSSRTLASGVPAFNATAGLTAVAHLASRVGITVSPMVAFVDYGLAYDNAFWDGHQMCFGTGDGRYFGDFTRPVDVCSHERWHGVTGDLLAYADQAGALNESMSDIAGAVSRQQALGLALTDPTMWLIGTGLLLETQGVTRGLRDMLHPGSGYNTPTLGKDPQPDNMAGYVTTTDDNGGVHLNSGIPNRAFALACLAVGDTAPVFALWCDVLLRASYPTNCTFRQWAQLTVDRASSPTLAAAVAAAWQTVGVSTTARTPIPTPAPAPDPTTPVPSTNPDHAVLVLEAALKRALAGHNVPSYLRTAAEQWLAEMPSSS